MKTRLQSTLAHMVSTAIRSLRLPGSPAPMPSAMLTPVSLVNLRAVVLTDAGKAERDAPAAINKWMEKKVAHYKQLRGGIKLVSSVPKSPSGKLLRRGQSRRPRESRNHVDDGHSLTLSCCHAAVLRDEAKAEMEAAKKAGNSQRAKL